MIVRLDADTDRAFFQDASCAFGVFDGVHIGHRFLIEETKKTAVVRDAPSLVLTFSIDPDELFAPGSLVKLMSNEVRIDTLSDTGVDAVVVLPFDKSFAELTPEDFLDWVFGCYEPRYVHVGEGFRFGRGASGTVDALRSWGFRRGLNVCEHSLLNSGKHPVSSTRIRSLLTAGRIAEAEALLGASCEVALSQAKPLLAELRE